MSENPPLPRECLSTPPLPLKTISDSTSSSVSTFFFFFAPPLFSNRLPAFPNSVSHSRQNLMFFAPPPPFDYFLHFSRGPFFAPAPDMLFASRRPHFISWRRRAPYSITGPSRRRRREKPRKMRKRSKNHSKGSPAAF